jgi:hypothetical protein
LGVGRLGLGGVGGFSKVDASLFLFSNIEVIFINERKKDLSSNEFA